jgi:BirA family biotin operon repressor/biotin-[acetyl-CoA-carboxylase] ligase
MLGVMMKENNRLSRRQIEGYLKDCAHQLHLEIHESVDSTNTLAKNYAIDGAPEGTVVIAEHQTKGKGRMGRSFYSPEGTGVYFSIVLRPMIQAEEALFITTSAAVAVARAIEKVSGSKAEIKWVNDIYCNGKKVCGILTEAGMSAEKQCLDYAILGIGINVIKPEGDFPEDIRNRADAIFNGPCNMEAVRNQLVAEVLNEFWTCYEQGNTKAYMTEYRKRSFLIGQQVYINGDHQPKPALVLDIDEEARLVVEYPDGTQKALSSGEVSAKPMMEMK